MKLLLTIALYGVLLGLLATRPRADDIDIYLAAGAIDSSCSPAAGSENAGAGAAPLVAGSTIANPTGQGNAERDVFLPLFQPQPWPLWPGNIKKLKFLRAPAGVDGPVDDLLTGKAPPDSAALSLEDGQILPDVLSFWTDPLGADVQGFDPDRLEVPGRDGRSVTRGGAGQRIHGFLSQHVALLNAEPGARQLYTLDPARPAEMLALDATAATLAAIAGYLDPAAIGSTEQGLDLLRWLRGRDSYDADADGDREETRSWLLADVLHSRPLAISYGARPGTAYSSSNPDVRIFFGTNDGLLHSLRNTTESGQESGRETWAFIPPQLLGMQHELALNHIREVRPHPYGLDGEAVAVIDDRDGDGNIEVADGDTVRVVIGQRRGGRAIYAFDVSNPDSPRYLWTINHLSPGFGQLGLTFSTPRVARLDLGGSGPSSMLVFAGGYHGGWAGADRVGKDAGGGADFIGNAIYVVNPADGSLIWRAVGPAGGVAPVSTENLHYSAELTHSLPSPVTLIDSDHNGFDDRAYVGDSGGNVWRIELKEYGSGAKGATTTATQHWSLRRLAALGGSAASDRRFFHAPDVVQSRDAAGDYDGVLIVSGNRAQPGETRVSNFAYLLKDRATAAADSALLLMPAVGHEELADITLACTAAGKADCIAANLASGWKLRLQSAGEKGLSTPLVSSGRVFFTTYVPSSGNAQPDTESDCGGSAGRSRVYGVSLRDGSPALLPPGQLEPDSGEPVGQSNTGRFQDTGPGLQGGLVPLDDQVLLPGHGLDGMSLLTVPGGSRWRAYWREEAVDVP